jgi:Skp family chaperone for outer membrane proteins
MQNDVSGDVRNAAEQVADEKHFKLVVTRQFVGYGGTDITADVERILKITEASPSGS